MTVPDPKPGTARAFLFWVASSAAAFSAFITLMSNALATQQSTALRPASQFDLSPQNFEQALTFSNYLAESDMVPKDFKGKPGNCLIAMQ